MVSIISVPYHLDEHLPDLVAPLLPDADAIELAVELPREEVWPRLGRLYDAVADAVEQSVRAGSLPIVVSGDCTVSIGMTTGLQRAGVEPSIVWFDAHGDLQSLETTSSGYLGGMALRVLIGYRPELVSRGLGLRAPADDRVLLVGARDLDPAEVDYLATSGVRQSTIDELSADSLPAGPLLVNLDLDVVDPEHLPGLRYPAPDGPDVPSVLAAMRTVVETGRVAALNIACTWRPGGSDPDGVRDHLVSDVLSNVWEHAG